MPRWWMRLRNLHFHQWYLRLDDWTLECTRCGATRRERRIPNH